MAKTAYYLVLDTQRRGRAELVDAGPRHRRDLGGRPHRPTTTTPETERWRRDELTGTQDRM
jgi:hypothetical protein